MEKLDAITLRDIVERKRLKFIESYWRFSEDSENSNGENSLLLNYAIDLIITTSKKMGLYNPEAKSADNNLYNEIIRLNPNELQKIAKESYQNGAISIIRYVIAQMFIRNEINSAEHLNDTIEQLKNDFIDKNI